MSDQESTPGYKQPPVHSRWKKGQSGNPKGRPKRLEFDIPTILTEVLKTKVTITEDGNAYSVTALEAIMRRLLHDATVGIPGRLELLQAFQRKIKFTSPNRHHIVVQFVESTWSSDYRGADASDDTVPPGGANNG